MLSMVVHFAKKYCFFYPLVVVRVSQYLTSQEIKGCLILCHVQATAGLVWFAMLCGMYFLPKHQWFLEYLTKDIPSLANYLYKLNHMYDILFHLVSLS